MSNYNSWMLQRTKLCMRFMASATLILPLAFAGWHHHGVSQRRLLFSGKFRDGVSLSSPASKRRVLAKAQNAVNEEVVETQSSELKNGTQRTPSSSKLVLVVGGSGGVGKRTIYLDLLYCFPSCCYHIYLLNTLLLLKYVEI